MKENSIDKLPYLFHDDRREIRFDRFDLPAPWINYLSNGRMHAFVSQAGGGMTWWLSPMMFRLTRYYLKWNTRAVFDEDLQAIT